MGRHTHANLDILEALTSTPTGSAIPESGIITDGLLCRWSGLTKTLVDSVSGRIATVGGAEYWCFDPLLRAYCPLTTYTGTTILADATGLPAGASPVSIMCWSNYGRGGAFGYGNNVGAVVGESLGINTGSGYAHAHIGGDTGYSSSILFPTGWAHVCATYDGTNIRLYSDGLLGLTQAATLNLVPAKITIGGYYYTLGVMCGGITADSRVYNRCLSAAEVAQIAAFKA